MGIHGIQGCTGVHRGAQGCTEVHRGTQGYTGVHKDDDQISNMASVQTNVYPTQGTSHPGYMPHSHRGSANCFETLRGEVMRMK